MPQPPQATKPAKPLDQLLADEWTDVGMLKNILHGGG